ncbi:hypothetical protein FHR71_003671 [Methylobacterium sp. RAS18]|nr:hypothetical protein [Methylobacterium sp. RAS18]
MPHHRYVRAADLVSEFGFTERHWVRQAAAGRVPGARQPFGAHSHWVFDIEAVRSWWACAEREPEPKPTPRLRTTPLHRFSAKPPVRHDIKKQLARLLAEGRPPPKRR